jgi:hypothetical protein
MAGTTARPSSPTRHGAAIRSLPSSASRIGRSVRVKYLELVVTCEPGVDEKKPS